MRVLLVGDIHLADKGPSLRREGYLDQILDKLKHASQIAGEENCDHTVWVGDVFHIKTPSRNSHEMVQRTIDLIQRWPTPVTIVPGNHDVRHDRLDTIDSQPLGTLYLSGARVGSGLIPDTPIYCIPYTENPEIVLYHCRKAKEAEAQLIVAHLSIMPPGVTQPYEFFAAEDLAEMLDHMPSLYYGHIHDNHGMYEVERGSGLVTMWFCNHGALSRASLHESDLGRKPAVTVWDNTWSVPFKRMEIRHLPIEDVMLVSQAKAEAERQSRTEQFLEMIGKTSLARVSTESLQHTLRERQDISEEVKRLAIEILEEVSK